MVAGLGVAVVPQGCPGTPGGRWGHPAGAPGPYSLAESDMSACRGRQPIMQTIMAGKMEMVLPAMYMMNRFMGICFSGASATSQQRCGERGRGCAGGHPPQGTQEPPQQRTRVSGTGTNPPTGHPGACVCVCVPAHLLHEDFVALVDAALPQLSLGEPQRPAALGGSAGPAGKRGGAGEAGGTPWPLRSLPRAPPVSPPPRCRRQLQRPLEAPPANRCCRRHLASARMEGRSREGSHEEPTGTPRLLATP